MHIPPPFRVKRGIYIKIGKSRRDLEKSFAFFRSPDRTLETTALLLNNQLRLRITPRSHLRPASSLAFAAHG